MPDTPELNAARRLAAQVAASVQQAPSFRTLDAGTRTGLVRDLTAIQQSLAPADPYALTLDDSSPWMAHLRDVQNGGQQPTSASGSPPASDPAASTEPAQKRPPATETLAARTGALVDEIDFPAFVAGLVHGTFDAVVDATIRQMEAFANLVSAVAKDVDDFTNENITPNQVRDDLAHRYPGDLYVDTSGQTAALRVRATGEDGDPPSPSWLADYGLGGEELTDELVETRLVPSARRTVGESRQQLLATMVLLGMSRINVKDGRVSAKVRFRAAANDHVSLDYATSQDPGGGSSWGTRGSSTYDSFNTMVSTVGVNAQSDTDLKAELFGEVEINFVSETMPLDRFADPARQTLLRRSANWRDTTPAAAPQASLAAAAPPVVAAPPAVPAAAPATSAPAPPASAVPDTAPVAAGVPGGTP